MASSSSIIRNHVRSGHRYYYSNRTKSGSLRFLSLSSSSYLSKKYSNHPVDSLLSSSTSSLIKFRTNTAAGSIGSDYFSHRFNSSVGGGDSKNGNSNSNNKNNDKYDNDDDGDPFGLNFDDGTDLGNIGRTTLQPPRYKRDAVTGKFTGEKEEEITERDRKLLNMDPIQEEEYLLDKVLKEWDLDEVNDEDDDSSSPFPEPIKLSELAQRIRRDNAGMTMLGRSVESQTFVGKLEDGEDSYVDKTGFSKPLSPAEFKVFRKHMKDEYDVVIDEDDIPVEPTTATDNHHNSGSSSRNRRKKDDDSDDDDNDDASSLFGDGGGLYADTEELNTKWMSSNAMRFMDDTIDDDDPFSDLIPTDLSPTLLVNRRKAKPIPRKLFHHNNLALLRRYITPSGQIMNRVQSRLGAKDQRKVSKLIKRARHLGLIPTSGQFVVENHGSIHEKDIQNDNEWEKELIRRGLTISDQQKQKKN